MGMTEYHEALKLIRSNSDEADFEGEQSEALVALAEKTLGLTFPEPYRSFLLDLGCGDFAGEEIFGIIDEEFEASAVPDAVWFTRELRKSADFPQNLLGIGEMAEHEIVVLDCGKNSPTSGALFLLALESPFEAGSWEQIAPDFGEYLLSLVRTALQEE